MRGLGLLDRFGVRLGIILSLAMAPVGIIALVQTANIDATSRARTEAVLSGRTLQAAAAPLSYLSQVRGAAQGLAVNLAAATVQSCETLVKAVTGPDRAYAFAAFYGLDGKARCASGDRMADVSDRPFFSDYITRLQPDLRMIRSDVHLAPDTLVALAPVMASDNRPQGFVAIAPYPERVQNGSESASFSLVLFDRRGDILSGIESPAALSDLLPKDVTLSSLAMGTDTLFAGQSTGGQRMLYSANTLVPGQIFALGAWPERRQAWDILNGMSPLFLTLATWCACLMAAWAGAELMVTRHMRRFRRAMAAFAKGDRRLKPIRLEQAPAEIRGAAEAFDYLTETILRDEAELENSLHEKEVLLREVHHRVKNNLQLMASIINLQLRRTRSDEAKRVMRRLQDRMLSLATVHNSLFHTANLTEVRADPLFAGIVDQIIVSGAGAGQRLTVDSTFDPIIMSPEQVVPLALLLTEVLGRAMKTAPPPQGDILPRIILSLRREGAEAASLTVESDVDPAAEGDEADRDDSALGNQLIHAFALQLEGIFRRDIHGTRQVQRLEFPYKSPGTVSNGQTPQG